MDTSTLSNPFRVWAELARGLRTRFTQELGEPPYSPVTSDIITTLASVAMRCDSMSASLKRLNQNEPQSFDAFLRALEASGK